MNNNNPRKTKDGKFTSKIKYIYDITLKEGRTLENIREAQYIQIDAFNIESEIRRPYMPVYWH